MESSIPIHYQSHMSSPLRIKAIVFLILLQVLFGVSCSEDPVIITPDPVIQTETRIIPDIYYVDDTYFFLDDPNGPFIQPKVGEIEVFVSVNEIERQNPEMITFIGLAFVDTTARGGPIRDAKAAFQAGQATPPREEGYFKELFFGPDYRYILDANDESIIGIELNQRVDESRVLAVRYVNVLGDTIGNYYEYPVVPEGGSPEDYPLFLELIKPRNPRPDNQFGYTWDFMMRFIYNLGLTNIDASTLEIEIKDLSLNLINTSPPGETVPYIRIFGLDRFNDYGDPEPDGRVDLQAGLIDFNRGLLAFPSVRPFDPDIVQVAEWTERDDSFVVPEDYVNLNLANPTIYDDYLSPLDLQNARRYDIVVRVVGKCPCGEANTIHNADRWRHCEYGLEPTSFGRGSIHIQWNSSSAGTERILMPTPWLEALQ